MSEFLHHVVANREYIQRDMAWLSESEHTDPWESSTPIPYALTMQARRALYDAILNSDIEEEG